MAGATLLDLGEKPLDHSASTHIKMVGSLVDLED